MADYFISGSFAFHCTQLERALLEEVFAAASDLMDDCDPGEPTLALGAILPPTDPADCWSGLRDLFSDPRFPAFGADIAGASDADAPGMSTVCIHGSFDFQAEPIANLIVRCCRTTLQARPIGFQWAETCSKPRIDEFGGGWCAIFADGVQIQSTSEALSAALAARAS